MFRRRSFKKSKGWGVRPRDHRTLARAWCGLWARFGLDGAGMARAWRGLGPGGGGIRMCKTSLSPGPGSPLLKMWLSLV
eukprot:gene17489-biopygen23349